MAHFVEFQHERYRIERNTRQPEFEARAYPKRERSIIIHDRVIIWLRDGNQVTTLSLTPDEIKLLKIELDKIG